MSDNSIRELARAVRTGDLKAAEAALNELHAYAHEVEQGRMDADHARRRDEPLPPLGYDPLKYIDGWRYDPSKTVEQRRAWGVK